MKSILKQVLTVALLLSVPAIFAAEQKATTGRFASMKSSVKAGASKATTFVATKSKAAAKFTSAKAGQLRNWTLNNDSKLKTGAKVTLVAAVTGALVYGMYKLPSLYRKAKNALKKAKPVAAKAVVTTPATPAVVAAPAPVIDPVAFHNNLQPVR